MSYTNVGRGGQRSISRRDFGALLKALRLTESRLSSRKNRPMPWTDRVWNEIIIKIINRIYKIFFLRFYMNNSKNGRNQKILYCKYDIENDSRRHYANKYMFFFFYFVSIFFFFYVYTGDFYLLSVAEQPYLHNKRSREEKKNVDNRGKRNEFQSIRSTT